MIFILHRYSFHLPDVFNRKRDEKKIAKRIKEIREEITPFMKKSSWIVFASDETRIVWEAIIRRMWLSRGKRAVINVEKKKKAQSFIGFLNLKTGDDLLFKLAWQKQDTIRYYRSKILLWRTPQK